MRPEQDDEQDNPRGAGRQQHIRSNATILRSLQPRAGHVRDPAEGVGNIVDETLVALLDGHVELAADEDADTASGVTTEVDDRVDDVRVEEGPHAAEYLGTLHEGLVVERVDVEPVVERLVQHRETGDAVLDPAGQPRSLRVEGGRQTHADDPGEADDEDERVMRVRPAGGMREREHRLARRLSPRVRFAVNGDDDRRVGRDAAGAGDHRAEERVAAEDGADGQDHERDVHQLRLVGVIVHMMIARLAHECEPPAAHHVERRDVGDCDRQPEQPLRQLRNVARDGHLLRRSALGVMLAGFRAGERRLRRHQAGRIRAGAGKLNAIVVRRRGVTAPVGGRSVFVLVAMRGAGVMRGAILVRFVGVKGAIVGDGEDLVLAEEAAETELEMADLDARQTEAGDGEDADEECPACDGHLLAETAHLHDVLLVMAALDDLAGAEEHHRLEEGVGHEVEQGRRPGADTHAEDHVTELAECRVGEDLLDIRLNDGDQRGHRQRDAADDGDEELSVGRQQSEDAGDEIDARRDHRGGVDEGGYGRRAGHGVRQPDVQRELGALAHGAAEQTDAHERGECHAGHMPAEQVDRISKDACAGRELVAENGGGLIEIERVRVKHDQGETDDEAEVAHAVRDERLHGGVGGVLLIEVEADQQVGAETDEFPEDEEEQQAAADDEAEHTEAEEAEVGEEPMELHLSADFVAVAGHVTDAEEVDPARDEGHHEVHDDRERIQFDADVDGDVSEVRPVIAEGVGRQARLRFGGEADPADQDIRRQDAAEGDRAEGEPAGERLAEGRLRSEEGQDRKADQRDHDAEGETDFKRVVHDAFCESPADSVESPVRDHRDYQPRSSSPRSTSIVRTLL